MKLLVFICALLAVEAAKLQGYETPHPGSGGVPLPAPSRSSPSVFTASAGSHHQVPLTPGGHFSQHQKSPLSSNGQSFEHQLTPLTPAGPFNRATGPSFSVASEHKTQDHHAGLNQPSFNGQISGSNIHGGVSPTGPSGPANQFPFESGVDGHEESCPEGQLRHLDGTCVVPEITRKVFVYAAPATEPRAPLPPVDVPLPKEEHNIVFIRTADRGDGPEPIIIPPPQKKHLIYVLNKDSGSQEPKIIEIPAPEPKEPEVYFVNYADGENPTLPHGIDFESALNSAIHGEGQVIGSSQGGAPLTGEHGLSHLGTGSEDVRHTVGPVDSGFIVVTDSDSSNEDFISGNDISASFGVSSGGPQNFVNNGRFTNGNGNGIVGPSVATYQAPTNNGAGISHRFNNGIVGPSTPTHQAPSNNGGVIPQRFSSNLGGSPAAVNQAPTRNGAAVPQRFYSSP
ncbi:uncharacterized protein [Palaemon carinicauda]|uniref:uncharacterized protein n=1 Tax=Palaemon carinicauda TaxID=392227 RepID=UPI0035B66E98